MFWHQLAQSRILDRNMFTTSSLISIDHLDLRVHEQWPNPYDWVSSFQCGCYVSVFDCEEERFSVGPTRTPIKGKMQQAPQYSPLLGQHHLLYLFSDLLSRVGCVNSLAHLGWDMPEI